MTAFVRCLLVAGGARAIFRKICAKSYDENWMAVDIPGRFFMPPPAQFHLIRSDPRSVVKAGTKLMCSLRVRRRSNLHHQQPCLLLLQASSALPPALLCMLRRAACDLLCFADPGESRRGMPSHGKRTGAQKIRKRGSSQGKRGATQQARQHRGNGASIHVIAAGQHGIVAMYKPQRAVIVWSHERARGREGSQKRWWGWSTADPGRSLGVAWAPQCLCADDAVNQD